MNRGYVEWKQRILGRIEQNVPNLIPLGDDCFRALEPGDQLYYAAGQGDNHIEAVVEIVSFPAVSISARIVFITQEEVDERHKLKVGDEIVASSNELFRQHLKMSLY